MLQDAAKQYRHLEVSDDIHESRNEQKMDMVSRRDQKFLKTKGYTMNDLLLWYTVLTSPDDESASRSIVTSCIENDETLVTKREVPTFVILTFLQRQNLGPNSIRSIVLYCWGQIYSRKPQACPVQSAEDVRGMEVPLKPKNATMNDSALFIAIVRLLRHARKAWPEALLTVSRLFISLMELKLNTLPQLSRTRRRSARRTVEANRVLKLLSLPSSLNPFHSVQIQQRAQFEVLQKMATLEPPLTINREGYRAIIAVQLANKKTEREHDWHSLKAPTWPPWKQDKTGFDTEKGYEYGISRAMEAIIHARNAGYGSLAWEKVCQILAGWDLDRSPTIQTRALMVHKSVRTDAMAVHKNQREKLFWAARVRATRTIQEAWACFLAHDNEGLPPSQLVCSAMLERLQAEQDCKKRSSHVRLNASNKCMLPCRKISAGDSKEMEPTPMSPKEQTYVRSPPPSLPDFVTRMQELDVLPTKPTLNLIISRAQSLDDGLRYTQWGVQADRSIASLLSQKPEDEPGIHSVDVKTLTAYIKLLCRFSHKSCGSYSPEPGLQGQARKARNFFQGNNPLVLAYRLLQTYKPAYRPPWLSLLPHLAETIVVPELGTRSGLKDVNQIMRWRLMQELLLTMKKLNIEVDADVFWWMCRGLERAIFAAIEVQDPSRSDSVRPKKGLFEDTVSSRQLEEPRDAVLSDQTFNYICALFHELMGSFPALPTEEPPRPSKYRVYGLQEDIIALPRLLSRPWPQILHAFVRVAGLLRNWNGMLEIVRWMAEHAAEIQETIDVPSNGPEMLRRSIVAVRVFSERTWVPRKSLPTRQGSTVVETDKGAPEETRNEIRCIVGGHEALWGPWPHNEEVELYMNNGRLPPE